MEDTFADKRERLVERLRDLRRRLDAPQDDVDLFELDLYSYDESLVTAADLLDVEVPKGARDEMSAEQRTVLEVRLAAAGIDVRATD
jgi:hypothetical protein